MYPGLPSSDCNLHTSTSHHFASPTPESEAPNTIAILRPDVPGRSAFFNKADWTKFTREDYQHVHHGYKRKPSDTMPIGIPPRVVSPFSFCEPITSEKPKSPYKKKGTTTREIKKAQMQEKVKSHPMKCADSSRTTQKESSRKRVQKKGN